MTQLPTLEPAPDLSGPAGEPQAREPQAREPQTREPLPTRQSLAARSERAGAALGYVLLLIAPFTLGFLAFVAIGLAWLRRNGSDEVARSHFRHQIKSFLDDAVVLVISVLVGWLALAGGLATVLGLSGVRLPWGLNAEHLGPWAIGLGLVWLALWLWGFVGLIVGSIRGLTRLAAGRTIGRKRHWG